MSVELFMKGEKTMFGIEIAFFAIGFLTCFVLLTIVTEVTTKEKENKRALRRKYRRMLDKQAIETNQEEINIDIKI